MPDKTTPHAPPAWWFRRHKWATDTYGQLIFELLYGTFVFVMVFGAPEPALQLIVAFYLAGKAANYGRDIARTDPEDEAEA